jgi:hypothetical protein
MREWFWDCGLPNFQLEVILIEEPSDAFADHADGDVAGFDTRCRDIESCISADDVSMVFQCLRVAMQWRDKQIRIDKER